MPWELIYHKPFKSSGDSISPASMNCFVLRRNFVRRRCYCCCCCFCCCCCCRFYCHGNRRCSPFHKPATAAGVGGIRRLPRSRCGGGQPAGTENQKAGKRNLQGKHKKRPVSEKLLGILRPGMVDIGVHPCCCGWWCCCCWAMVRTNQGEKGWKRKCNETAANSLSGYPVLNKGCRRCLQKGLSSVISWCLVVMCSPCRGSIFCSAVLVEARDWICCSRRPPFF